ncbi:MAG: hypothetical protein ACM3QZ_06495 [Solirubrobacterales bacterium]
MKRGLTLALTVLGLLTVLIGCSPKEKLSVGVDTAKLKSTFALASEDGKRLILFCTEPGVKPESLTVAIGENGRVLPVTFQKHQKANDQDSGRQTADNFDNMDGDLYLITTEKAEPDETYYLADPTVFVPQAILNARPWNDRDNSLAPPALDKKTLTQVEKAKGRKIDQSWILSDLDTGMKAALILFKRQGDNMLASIAFIKQDKVMFYDMPASYKDVVENDSAWRVDDGGEIGPGNFNILFYAQGTKGLIMGIAWGAPEGEAAFIVQEDGANLVETDIQASRYWVPL